MEKKERVSIEDLETAILWLECNDGKDGEYTSCQKVANWLDEEIRKRENRKLKK